MNQVNSPAFYQQAQPNPASLSQQQHQNGINTLESELFNEGLVDPILKSKDLLNQLKVSLQNLLGNLTLLINPSNESRVNVEKQFQLFGKSLEDFNRVCDLLTVNLKSAHEAQSISNELRYLYRSYAHIGPHDANRNEHPLLNSVNIQTQRIHEFKTMLQNFLDKTPQQTN